MSLVELVMTQIPPLNNLIFPIQAVGLFVTNNRAWTVSSISYMNSLGMVLVPNLNVRFFKNLHVQEE